MSDDMTSQYTIGLTESIYFAAGFTRLLNYVRRLIALQTCHHLHLLMCLTSETLSFMSNYL